MTDGAVGSDQLDGQIAVLGIDQRDRDLEAADVQAGVAGDRDHGRWWRIRYGEPAGGTNLGKSIADPVRVPSTTGPIVLEMIRGPAAMVIGWYQMLSG